MYIDAVNAVSDSAAEDKYMSIDKMYVSYFDNLDIGEKNADWRVIVSELERS
jgi:hypothetical protein